MGAVRRSMVDLRCSTRLIWQSEALAVLHGTLDFRRSIDVPGYERIDLHPATRFIATMNYGYAGTKELNEALVSRLW